MAPQASKQAAEKPCCARDWREKRDTRETRNPKLKVQGSKFQEPRPRTPTRPAFPARRASLARLTIHIGSCTSNGINSEQVPGAFSVLTIPSLSSQASAQSEKRFLTLFPDYLFRLQAALNFTITNREAEDEEIRCVLLC